MAGCPPDNYNVKKMIFQDILLPVLVSGTCVVLSAFLSITVTVLDSILLSSLSLSTLRFKFIKLCNQGWGGTTAAAMAMQHGSQHSQSSPLSKPPSVTYTGTFPWTAVSPALLCQGGITGPQGYCNHSQLSLADSSWNQESFFLHVLGNLTGLQSKIMSLLSWSPLKFFWGQTDFAQM